MSYPTTYCSGRRLLAAAERVIVGQTSSARLEYMKVKTIIAAVLAISSAACFHNFVLSLAADVLVPARSLRRDVIALTFFAVIAIGGGAGAAKLWDRWRVVFGWSAIVTAFGTAQLMMASHSDPAPSASDKLAAYLTVAVVVAAGALVLLRKHRRPNQN